MSFNVKEQKGNHYGFEKLFVGPINSVSLQMSMNNILQWYTKTLNLQRLQRNTATLGYLVTVNCKKQLQINKGGHQGKVTKIDS